MTYLIAEAGTAYLAGETARDQMVIARAFLGAAQAAGANAVKFQMFIPEEPLFCPMPGDEKRFTRWNRSRMTLAAWKVIQDAAKGYPGFDVLWSAFQPTCVEWLKTLKPRYVKVASRAFGSHPPIDAQLIVSVPNSDRVPPADSFALKCVPNYPAALGLCGWDTRFDGLSDHSGTIWPGLDAIFHRAKFLEVHFKVPGADMGNDEPVCLTVDQLKLLCEARNAFAAMHPNPLR